MELLQQLAAHLESRHHEYGLAARVLSDTFTQVRRLLEHEVDFLQEHQTLLKASDVYRSIRGVRIPRLLAELCGRRLPR